MSALGNYGSMSKNNPPCCGSWAEQVPERADGAGGVDADELNRAADEVIIAVGHGPSITVVGVFHLSPPVSLQIVIAQDRIERDLLGINLLEFFLKLGILKIFHSMLDIIVPQHQHQVATQLITGDCSFYRNILLLHTS